MISKEQIEKVKEIILTKFSEQVDNGVQSKNLETCTIKNIKACGQFFIQNREQRGVHGTSAALRVLAEGSDNNIKSLIPKLINYLEHKSQIEYEITNESDGDDENNIIKLSEQLYALSFIKAGQSSNAINLASTIKEKFDKCQIQNKGWSYFVDDLGSSELLPTSFVIMALYSNKYSNEDAIKFIKRELEKNLKDDINDPSTFAIVIFALYVLTFKVDKSAVKDSDLKQIFNKIRNSKFYVLDENIEQNIEYWIGAEHYYIRVPWQLYIIALSSFYSQLEFSKIKTQKRLMAISDSYIHNGGFKYKYSGEHLSTRTTSIVFDTLSVVENNLGNKILYKFFNLIDKIRVFIGSKWIRYPILIGLNILCVYTIYLWFNSDDPMSKKMSDMGINFLIYFLLLLYGIGKKKK